MIMIMASQGGGFMNSSFVSTVLISAAIVYHGCILSRALTRAATLMPRQPPNTSDVMLMHDVDDESDESDDVDDESDDALEDIPEFTPNVQAVQAQHAQNNQAQQELPAQGRKCGRFFVYSQPSPASQ